MENFSANMESSDPGALPQAIVEGVRWTRPMPDNAICMMKTMKNTPKQPRMVIAMLAIALASSIHAQSSDDNWGQWRGPANNGVSTTAKPPVEWSEQKNVHWKVAIDGNGSSSPIVWGNRVFLLTAVNTGNIDPSLPKPEDRHDQIPVRSRDIRPVHINGRCAGSKAEVSHRCYRL